MSTPAELPTVSIITIFLNAGATIERTICCALANKAPGVEYIIVDGGSRDGTLEIANRYRDQIDLIVSEKDRGISDAMNRGIAFSRNEYHIFAHADDRMMPGAVEVLRKAAARRHAPVVCGNAKVVAGDRLVRIFKAKPELLWTKMSLPHMGCLVRKDVWQAIGGYDVSKKIGMDHKFMLQIFRHFGKDAFVTVDMDVTDYSIGGVSHKRIYDGFREFRANLREAGASWFFSQTAYLVLVGKTFIHRMLRGL